MITQNSQAIRVRTTGANLKKVLIYVRGLDAITTKQEVAEAIGRNVDLKATECGCRAAVARKNSKGGYRELQN